MRRKRPSSTLPPGTVIDLEEYAHELREVRGLIEAPRESEPVCGALSDVLGDGVYRERSRISRKETAGLRGGRLAVATGQYLLWHFKGVEVPRCCDSGPNDTPFYDLFHLYWGLLTRRLQLDWRTAADLVQIDMHGRGDTEPRHALVKLLEQNFTPPAQEPLNSALRRWGDELAIHPRANYRKLANRVFLLAGRS